MNNTPTGDELLPETIWIKRDERYEHALEIGGDFDEGTMYVRADLSHTPAPSATVGGEREEVVPGTREAIIHAVEQEMGYYDMPEEQPEISFTGKDVCELVDLAKRLMAENDELDDAAHVKSLEIIELKKQLRALATPQPARLTDDEVEGLKMVMGGQMPADSRTIEAWKGWNDCIDHLRERGII